MARSRNRQRAGQPQAQTPPSQQLVAQVTQASFAGPIPPPSLLSEYNDIVPDAANRILTMAEKQAEHRMALETFAVHSEVARSYWGLGAAALVALSIAGLAAAAIFTDHDAAGAALGTIDLVGIIGTFIYGNETRRRDLRNRVQVMTGRK